MAKGERPRVDRRGFLISAAVSDALISVSSQSPSVPASSSPIAHITHYNKQHLPCLFGGSSVWVFTRWYLPGYFGGFVHACQDQFAIMGKSERLSVLVGLSRCVRFCLPIFLAGHLSNLPLSLRLLLVAASLSNASPSWPFSDGSVQSVLQPEQHELSGSKGAVACESKICSQVGIDILALGVSSRTSLSRVLESN